MHLKEPQTKATATATRAVKKKIPNRSHPQIQQLSIFSVLPQRNDVIRL